LVAFGALGTAIGLRWAGEAAEAHGPATAQGRAVQFVFMAPEASRVSLVGDFNGWDSSATLMQPGPADGLWTASVPLGPGRHVYAFIVDGSEWRADPAAPLAPDDGFGKPNSVITVDDPIS
jgi:1,4-alpha-glucan branching enzyme